MSGSKQAIVEAAIRFLEVDTEYTDASVRANADPENDDKYRRAHMLGEQREDLRRHLADCIIESDPAVVARVRKAVRFGANAWQESSGSVSNKPPGWF